jgi:formylglycine-generating enzyme required for sulfatase activity
MRKLFLLLITITLIYSCGGSRMGGGVGGELVGVPVGKVWDEPSPYNMVLVSRGAYTMGGEIDSIWGINIPTRGVSVDNFWMDETEITNSQYKQFVFWVRDSIIRERMADPAYAGDDFYKITEDIYGEPVTPHLNWSIPIPWIRNTEEEEAAINSLYKTHPITGEKMLEAQQMNFRYEWYDAGEAAKRQYQVAAEDKSVLISKDTAYITPDGRIVNETIMRPHSSHYDFVHTYIVNVYPDTTTWINDFDNSNNEIYMRNYFSHPAYSHYPVVGVSWEQATAFCEWRTLFLRKSINRADVQVEKFRLPTEAEWELAARSGNSDNIYPWGSEGTTSESGCYQANFNPGEGAYAADNYLITAPVRSFKPNNIGLYDMAGNVAEWTSTSYTEAGNELMGNINPEFIYNASVDDPNFMKRKVVKGGSWKDIATFIRADTRDSESQNKSRSYIGFRCVRTQLPSNR